MAESSKTSCPRCGAAFECGVAAGKSHCWCFDKPRVENLPREFEGCLCPACLQKLQQQASTKD